jgi:hypothetical protein
MRRAWMRSYRDCVIAVIVLCGHVLLVLLFARAREQTAERSAVDNMHDSTLILIPLREPDPTAVLPEPVIARSTLINIPLPRNISEPTAPAPPSSPLEPPGIDWRHEAERSANQAIQMQLAPKPRGFEERAAPAPPPKARSFGWDPSPGKVGFSAGLPYVKVGKRCVVGLGFFGCAIGELPDANGQLFEGMDDPDRERSSVPDASH